MIPVILIHLNESDYLLHTVEKTAKNNKVYLLTNVNYTNYANANLDILDINTFSSSKLNKFLEVYEHMYIGPKEPVLFWFERWFILLEFMNQYNLDIVFYIDSDVLLFTDINNEWHKYNQYVMTLIHGCCGSTSFITKLGLQNFIDMVIKTYSDKTHNFYMLVNKFQTITKFGTVGGICDMSLLQQFALNDDSGGGFTRVGEMMQIIDDTTYDHNINVSDLDYDMLNGIKKLEIIDNKIAIYNNRLNKHINFNGLHFQGMAKKYIPIICRETQHI